VAYLRVVASLVPQHMAVMDDDQFADMSDEELRDALAQMVQELGLPKAVRSATVGGATKMARLSPVNQATLPDGRRGRATNSGKIS
jgi:hypothetical protein